VRNDLHAAVQPLELTQVSQRPGALLHLKMRRQLHLVGAHTPLVVPESAIVWSLNGSWTKHIKKYATDVACVESRTVPAESHRQIICQLSGLSVLCRLM